VTVGGSAAAAAPPPRRLPRLAVGRLASRAWRRRDRRRQCCRACRRLHPAGRWGSRAAPPPNARGPHLHRHRRRLTTGSRGRCSGDGGNDNADGRTAAVAGGGCAPPPATAPAGRARGARATGAATRRACRAPPLSPSSPPARRPPPLQPRQRSDRPAAGGSDPANTDATAPAASRRLRSPAATSPAGAAPRRPCRGTAGGTALCPFRRQAPQAPARAAAGGAGADSPPPHRAHVRCRPLGRRQVRTAGTGGGGGPSACCCRRRRPSHVPFLFFFRSQLTLRSIHFLYPSLVLLFLGVSNDLCSYSSIPPPESSPPRSSPSSPISSLLCVHIVGQVRLCAKKAQIFVVVLFSHPLQSALSCRAGHCSLCLIVLTRVKAAATMTDTLQRWGLSLYFH